ncbi:hypothetical protein M3196_10140 [Fictibacillus nanhaiensis]|uniref:hypothetical protein n=1 Tax=Fictibacillus nanhaiensis TaxID=742169 RepID=UPI00203D8BFD|nr:hypothetical protein [Fictibacillus nanhaiensis]MCM3732018.1 hypothetical protein [Fictibacillus nanhaiensis]
MELKIISSVFQETEIPSISNKLLFILQEYCKDLELTSLECITIADDFAKAIEEYQELNKLKKIKPTHGEYGLAIGKVLRRKEENRYLYTVMLDARIVKGLFIEESSGFCTHYIHHEFCHVHDDTIKESIFTEEGKAGKDIHQLRHMMNVLAESVWCEYIVSRLCANTLSNFDTITQHLETLIPQVKTNSGKDKLAYRFHHDIGKLYYQVEEGITYLLKMLGTFWGYIHGIKDYDITDIHFESKINSLKDFIIQNYTKEIWDDLGEVLNNLFNKYPDGWNDVRELYDLGNVSIKLFRILGLSFEERGETFYINVP